MIQEALERLSQYMGRRRWQPIVPDLLSQDPDTARQDALAQLKSTGLRLSFERLESAVQATETPILAVTSLVGLSDPKTILIQFQAAALFWNHTSRHELGGASPIDHLKNRIKQRPDDEPWKVASEERDLVAIIESPEQFKDLPEPAEFGLPNDFFDTSDLAQHVSGPVTIEELPNARKRKTRKLQHTPKPRISRNQKCPCRSGSKYKNCCARSNG